MGTASWPPPETARWRHGVLLTAQGVLASHGHAWGGQRAWPPDVPRGASFRFQPVWLARPGMLGPPRSSARRRVLALGAKGAKALSSPWAAARYGITLQMSPGGTIHGVGGNSRHLPIAGRLPEPARRVGALPNNAMKLARGGVEVG